MTVLFHLCGLPACYELVTDAPYRFNRPVCVVFDFFTDSLDMDIDRPGISDIFNPRCGLKAVPL